MWDASDNYLYAITPAGNMMLAAHFCHQEIDI